MLAKLYMWADEGKGRTERMKITPVIDSIADREFDRFTRVAVWMPGGGWYDPVNGGPEMPSGVRGADWDSVVADCARLGRRRD